MSQFNNFFPPFLLLFFIFIFIWGVLLGLKPSYLSTLALCFGADQTTRSQALDPAPLEIAIINQSIAT